MKPFPFQVEGANWLTEPSRFRLLADDMGLGKTVQTILAFEELRISKILILCPASAQGVWQYEIETHGMYAYEIVNLRTSRKIPDADVVIISYGRAANKKVRDQLFDRAFDLLICDESHYLKNPESARTKSVLDSELGLVRNKQRVWFLSGTPMPNNPSEIWTTLRLANATKLKYNSFVKKYCTGYMLQVSNWRKEFCITGGKNLQDLRATLRPIMLRRTKSEVDIQLPPIYHTITVVDADVATAEKAAPFGGLAENYHRMNDVNMKTFVQQWEETNNEAEKMALLKSQVASVAPLRKYLAFLKIGGVNAYVRGLLETDVNKVVIFGHHVRPLQYLEYLLAEYEPCLVTGATVRRDIVVNRFQTGKDHRVFLGQIQAAGTAVTLTAASHILLIDPSYVPGDNAQAIMRCHRIGQTEAVFATQVTTEHKIDRQIQEILLRKIRTLTQVIGD